MGVASHDATLNSAPCELQVDRTLDLGRRRCALRNDGTSRDWLNAEYAPTEFPQRCSDEYF